MCALRSTSFALGLLLATPAIAQDHPQHQMPATHDHAEHQAEPSPTGTEEKTGKKPEASHESTTVSMNHAAMGHAPQDQQASQPVDHSTMDHGAPQAQERRPAVDHGAMGHQTPKSERPMDHAAVGYEVPPSKGAARTDEHAAMGPTTPAPTDTPHTPIPDVTDADRAAAFAYAEDHAMHDNTIEQYFLLDRLEGFDANGSSGIAWEAQSWIGTDLNKVWLRSEGERVDGHTESADLEVLYGRAFARWWDVVAGIRHDFKPGDSRDFLAIGVMGLAPYKFEVQATAYFGESGQTAARFEVEYETLLTNRLILQPLVELEMHGKDDPARGVGSGLSTAEAGVRLRYEFTRRFAPYIGIVYERAFGRTADFRRDDGEGASDTCFVAGVRIWF